MEFPLYPALQYRWRVEGDGSDAQLVYFGLRNPPGHTRNVISLPAEVAAGLSRMDKETPADRLPSALTGNDLYHQLVNEEIIVEAKQVREPAARDYFQQCTKCVTNDFLLPGLEFDHRGVCAFCQCYERAEQSGYSALSSEGASDEELLSIAAENRDSRFDVMALCTGGKDSTYLLWYLAKKLNLRVLAASWNMPYTNDTSRENLRRSIRLLPNVELVERTLPWNMVRRAMHEQFTSVGLPCLCPMTAHALFYPLAVQEHIPLFMHGVEEVQLAVMNYVMSEIQTTDPKKDAFPGHRANTLNFLRRICSTQGPAQPMAINADFQRYMASIRSVLAPVYRPLEHILDQAEQNPEMPIPHLRRLQSNTSYGSWPDMAALMSKEMGWQMPPGQKGLLHTSCRLEKLKDFCQFNRFQSMRSTTFPQSVVELGAGVYFGLISREAALEELQEMGYYQQPEVMAELLSDLHIDPDRMDEMGELPCSLGACST
ncbi:MAG: hypothetical protein ACOC0T_05495 [Desulfovermiculus sp.]